MQLTDFDQIPDGSKLYLRPVGRVSGARLAPETAFDYAGTGHRFAGAVIYARSPSKEVLAGYFSVEAVLKRLSDKPDATSSALQALLRGLAFKRSSMALPGDRSLSFNKPLVMGVLNVTPDSFSDGGKFLDHDKAVRRARAMMAEGADIIDIGGESTRPGATPVWEGDEADRIVPVIERLAADEALISVDTRHASVMEKARQAGAHIFNDVSALSHDPASMEVAAKSNVPIVLMHAQGDPRTMQDDPRYDHILLDIYDYLEERIRACEAAGIDRSRLIIDPGLGFGKRVVQDNLALLNGLMLFHTLGCPLLLGASRKRFIGAITSVEAADERVAGSLAVAVAGVREGAHILRVHDVAETAQAVKLAQALEDASVMDGLG